MPRRLPNALSWLRPDGLVEGLAVTRLLYRASPKLTLASLALATCSGLLAPTYMLATGALVETIRNQANATLPLLAIGAIFAAQRTIDPLREQIGHTLWPRTDAWLGERIMVAASAPAGLQELEDPKVLDLIAQARGAVTGFSPGQAAEQFAALWATRIQALGALVIVARWYWWAAPLLMLAYTLAFNATRWHFAEVTAVLLDRTDKLRRAYYLRGLALSSHIAKEARIFDLTDWLVQRYRSSSLAILHEVWVKRNEGWLEASVVVAIVAAIEVAVLAVVVRDAVQGEIGLGTAVAVAQAVLSAGLLSRYDEADWGCTEAVRSAGMVAAMEESTRKAGTPHRASDAVGASVSNGNRSADGLPRRSIRFENVTFIYPGRPAPVIENFNLEIEAGRSLAIVGENGSGKTTLVKLMTCLYDPTAGRISVDGVDLRDIAPSAWHRRVSALFQDFARFEMPAYDNVAFGALHAWDDAEGIRRAAADAGVLDTIERLTDGWQTQLSREYRNGAELSGGEWQRLAMARALFGVASGAGLLILDEPTASLDVRGEAEVYDRFLELTRGVTTIVISHRFSTVRRADRIVVVEGGRVVEDGTHDELVSRPEGRYAQMYRLQASRFAEVS